MDDDLETHDDVNTDDKTERIVNRLTNKNALFSIPNHKQLSTVVNWGFKLSRFPL